MKSFFSRYRTETLILGIGVLNILGVAFLQHAGHTASVPVLRFLDNERWTLENILISILTWIGVRRAAPGDRRARLFFFAGWTAYAIGELFWDIQVAIGWNPFPAPGDLFFLSLAPLIGIGFLTVLRKGMAPGEVAGIALDISGIAVMALTLTLALYLPEWRGMPLLTNLATILYPVFYFTMLGTGVLAVLVRRLRLRPGVVLSLVGMAGFACCWLEWNRRTLRGEPLDGTLLGYGFSVFSLVSGVGASRWRSDFAAGPRYAWWATRLQRLLPLLLVFAACVAVVFGNYHFDHAVGLVIDLGAVVMIVLAAARQSLVLHEQDQLLEAEEKLLRSEGQLRDLVRNSSDVIYGVEVGADGEFRCQSMNPAGEALGLREDELRGRTCHEFFPAGVADALVARYRACVAAGAPVNFDIALPTVAGLVWFEIMLVPLKNEQGRVARINGIARNISARLSDLKAAEAHGIELEQRVEERTRELQALNLSKDRLFNIIAHDLKNPMSAVLLSGEALLELARSSPVPPELVELAQVAYESSDSVNRLMLDLLAWGQIQMGRVEVRREAIDLHGLLRYNVEFARVTARKKDLVLLNRLEGPLMVHGDRRMLDTVVRNLLANAIKFTPSGGRVEAGASIAPDDPETVVIHVADSGTGIPPEKIATLFHLDKNESTEGTSGEMGTGLGLPLCREMVGINRGRLWVESSPHAGSTFRFTVPRGMAL